MKNSLNVTALLRHDVAKAFETLPVWCKLMVIAVTCVEAWRSTAPRRRFRR